MPRWRDSPDAYRPMLASLAEPPIAQKGWIYEPKYDGIRVIVDLRPPARAGREATVVLYSRNGREKQAQFPAIAAALAKLGRSLPGPVVLDGEIVAIDQDGRPLGFQYIQGRINLTSPGEIAQAERDRPAAILLFDLLRDGDEDLRGQPLAARRLRLQERIRPPRGARALVRLSELVLDDGRALLQRARAEGWEGLIGKDGQAPYQSGRRSPAWRKLKLLRQQEFVVGGWTEPRQTRMHFGALLVGYYDARGALRWAGSVGTGFDGKELTRVAALLDARARATSPFADRVKTPEPAHWVEPTLVVEVRFTEWTNEGLLRQPVYLGVRTDKSARDVRREDARGASEPPDDPGGAVRPAPASRTRSRARVATSPAARTTGSGARSRRGKGAAAEAALQAINDRLRALEDARRDGEIELPGGDVLHVTNLSKVFWPALRLTKGDLLRYYVTVSPLLLPAVDNRPLVMKRFPNGVERSAFYQQRHPEPVPKGVTRLILPPEIEPSSEEGPLERLIGGSLTTLLYTAQLAAISQDPWFSRVDTAPFQDHAAIDLDPGDGVDFTRVLQVARAVKEELDRYGIPATPKTSGASGLHIYIRLPPRTTYETGQLLCQMIATAVASKHRRIATVERMVRRRPAGTVYVDYLQNILGKTLATAYSARASDYAGVSTPLTWTEVAEGVDPRAFTIDTAPTRFAAVGDRWRDVLAGKAVDIEAVVRRGVTRS